MQRQQQQIANVPEEIKPLVQEFKNIDLKQQKLSRDRQACDTQLQENKMVKKELELLSENDQVFKKIGPVLIDQGMFSKMFFILLLTDRSWAENAKS